MAAESELFQALEEIQRRRPSRTMIGPVAPGQSKGERFLSQAAEASPAYGFPPAPPLGPLESFIETTRKSQGGNLLDLLGLGRQMERKPWKPESVLKFGEEIEPMPEVGKTVKPVKGQIPNAYPGTKKRNLPTYIGSHTDIVVPGPQHEPMRFLKRKFPPRLRMLTPEEEALQPG